MRRDVNQKLFNSSLTHLCNSKKITNKISTLPINLRCFQSNDSFEDLSMVQLF